MSKELFTHGFGYVRVGDGQEVSSTNYNADERLQELFYKNLVFGTDPWRRSLRPTMTMMYLRPGPFRYTKPNEVLVVSSPEQGGWRNEGGWGYVDQYYFPIDTYDFRYYFDPVNSRSSYTSPTYSTAEIPMTFGGVSMTVWGAPSGTSSAGEAQQGLPVRNWDGAALSFVDIPGTTIGTLWKHPPGRTAWFNEVGIVALSQGNIEIDGPYSPSESLLQTMGYQVYYTKSGGTGRPGNPANALLTAPVNGTNGTVTAPGTFVDGAAQGLFVASQASGFAPGSVLVTGTASSGSSTTLVDSTQTWTTDQYRDKLVQITSGIGAGQTRWIASNTATSVRVSVAWATPPDGTSAYRIIEAGSYYIRINSGAAKGTYLVLDVVDSNTLVLDAPAVNTPFSSASALSWEMVTGPVGEYFFRKRAYFDWDSWGNRTQWWQGNQLSIGTLQHELLTLQTEPYASAVKVIHDRGACWWSLANNGSIPLMRWVHMSPQCFEPMHTTGKISGLSSWPFIAYGTRDMAIDDQNKLWVVGDPTNGAVVPIRNGRTNTIRIDPYPAGNAHTPALVSSFSGDLSATATPSNPIGANDIRGVVCDDSKAYAPNTRVWLIPGPSDALNGVSYTDDYGANWKRLHPIHTRTGTADVSGTAVTGTGTLFTTEFTAGDWVRFNDGIGAMLSLTGTENGTYFRDTGNTSSVVTPVGAAKTTLVQSKFGDGSLALNGTDAYVSMPWNSDLTFGTGDFTVECWVYLTVTPNGEALITDQYTAGGDEIAWALHFTTTSPGTATGSNLSFASYNGSSWTGVVSTSTPPLNTWTHVAACRSGSTLTLFMDGVEIASGSFTTNIPAGEALWVGRRWDAGGTRDFVSGYMNDVRAVKGKALYTGAFTPPVAPLVGVRSYEVASISSDTSMTLVTSHATGVTGSPVSRGVFPTANTARTSVMNTPSNGGADIAVMRAPVDYDSDGNLIWLSEDRDFIVRWKQSDGNPSILPISAVWGSLAIDSSQCCSLTVQRVPNPNNQEPHRLHNSIWIGSRYQGMIRVEPAFTGASTRYSRFLTDNFPLTGFMPQGNDDWLFTNRVIVNPVDGQPTVYGKYRYLNNGTGFRSYKYVVGMDKGNLGLFVDQSAHDWWNRVWWSCLSPLMCADFDDIGLGMRALINPVRWGNDGHGNNNGAIHGELWMSKRWDGANWKFGAVDQIRSSLDFEQILSPAGPFLDFPVNVGTGVKRMHSDWQFLDEDTKLKIRFVDTNIQSVTQSQQFLVDENTTFICYIGQGKDSFQTAYWGIDSYQKPSFPRFQTETPKLAINMWTQDGGVEGGYSVSSTSTVNYTPPFARGVSIPSRTVPHGGAPYPNLSQVRVNSGPWQQYTATLRIKPQIETPGDGSIFGATSGLEQKFTSSTYTFVPADIGKSIIIEGVNGSAADVDNGQAVIMSIDPLDSKTVVTDKTFAANKTGLRWKLIDIPPVSYVVFNYEYAVFRAVHGRVQHWLYSSSDLGVTWQQVKFSDQIRSKPQNTDIRLYQDDGIFINVFNYSNKNNFDVTDNGVTSCPLIFDLRALPENVRRRQYWKIRRYDTVQDWDLFARSSGLRLVDENFKDIAIPANCLVDDASDPEYLGNALIEVEILAFSGTGITPVDIGTGNGRTDTLTFGGSFYLQSGTNNASFTNVVGESGSRFSSAAATFTPTDIGKTIRISGSTIPLNNRLLVISKYIDANTVVVDGSQTAESNSFSWALIPFGNGDALRVLDPTYTSGMDGTLSGISMADSKYTILDVPTSNTIVIDAKTFPMAVTNKPFHVEQDAGAGDYYNGNYIGSTSPSTPYDAQKRWSHDGFSGSLAWSAAHEFVTLQSDGLLTATSAADDDGDGRTDQIVIAATLVSTAVVGDHIMLSNTTNGRRVYEIKSILPDTPAAGQTTITVTYDEVFPSQTFSWDVLRRRNLLFTYPRLVTISK